MLIFNMRRVFALRGVDKPFSFMVRNGFPASTASGMLNYAIITVKIKSVEKLCVALNCTPSDLFEWRDDKNSNLPEQHQLNSLRREAAQNLTEIIKDLPLEQIADVKNFVEELRAKKTAPKNKLFEAVV